MRRFCFRLALALGMTVKELMSRIDSAELSEWIAYHRLEPFGQDRQDYPASIVASTVANVNRGKSTPLFKPSQFLPRFGGKDSGKGQSLDDMKAAFGRFAKRQKQAVGRGDSR